MRTSDADILLISGPGDANPDHWQSRWERSLATARRIDFPAGERPDHGAWTDRIVAEVERAKRSVVLVAHGLGALAVVHAAGRLAGGKVAGAFLVAPPAPDQLGGDGWPAVPGDRLPFPAVVVASRDDPHGNYAECEALARAWNVPLVDAGNSGHIDATSGHGPWPEGLMRFAGFMKGL